MKGRKKSPTPMKNHLPRRKILTPSLIRVRKTKKESLPLLRKQPSPNRKRNHLVSQRLHTVANMTRLQIQKVPPKHPKIISHQRVQSYIGKQCPDGLKVKLYKYSKRIRLLKVERMSRLPRMSRGACVFHISRTKSLVNLMPHFFHFQDRSQITRTQW